MNRVMSDVLPTIPDINQHNFFQPQNPDTVVPWGVSKLEGRGRDCHIPLCSPRKTSLSSSLRVSVSGSLSPNRGSAAAQRGAASDDDGKRT